MRQKAKSRQASKYILEQKRTFWAKHPYSNASLLLLGLICEIYEHQVKAL